MGLHVNLSHCHLILIIIKIDINFIKIDISIIIIMVSILMIGLHVKRYHCQLIIIIIQINISVIKIFISIMIVITRTGRRQRCRPASELLVTRNVLEIKKHLKAIQSSSFIRHVDPVQPSQQS